jgi:hypothetical protein
LITESKEGWAVSDRQFMWQLVKFEFTGTPFKQWLLRLFTVVVMAALFEGMLFILVNEASGGYGAVVLDVVLLSAVFYYPQWLRLPSFRVADLKSGLYAAPFYVYATRLPIPQYVLRRSRFVLSFVYTVGATVMAVALAYVYPGTVRSLFTLGEFGVFLTVWGLVSVALSGLIAACEVGGVYTTKEIYGYSTVFLLVILAALLCLKWLTGDIFIALTVELSKSAPLMGVAGTLALAAVLNGIWYLEAKRYARKVDYHV